MYRLVLAFAVASVFAFDGGAVRAQESRPPDANKKTPEIQKEIISIEKDDVKLSCYLARPVGTAPAPGLILVHEWWGLNDWIKKQADRYAEQGYAVLAVDLYRGEVATDRDHAHELMRGLADDRALADLKAAFERLHEHNATRGKPIGVLGWCMGGGYALRLAIAEPRISCTVICYGKPVTDVEQLRKMKGPVLGVWGADDRGIEVKPFQKALDLAGIRSTHRVYSHAGHAFLNETNKGGYQKEPAKKAWAEIDRFLEAELKKNER